MRKSWFWIWHTAWWNIRIGPWFPCLIAWIYVYCVIFIWFESFLINESPDKQPASQYGCLRGNRLKSPILSVHALSKWIPVRFTIEKVDFLALLSHYVIRISFLSGSLCFILLMQGYEGRRRLSCAHFVTLWMKRYSTINIQPFSLFIIMETELRCLFWNNDSTNVAWV